MSAIQNKESRASIDGTVFSDDLQLVEMLLSYLHHNQCIKQDVESNSGWAVTEKGKGWIGKYGGETGCE
jgi:hypothetical protein